MCVLPETELAKLRCSEKFSRGRAGEEVASTSPRHFHVRSRRGAPRRTAHPRPCPPPRPPEPQRDPLRNGRPYPNPDHAPVDVRALAHTHLACQCRGRGLGIGRGWRPPLAFLCAAPTVDDSIGRARSHLLCGRAPTPVQHRVRAWGPQDPCDNRHHCRASATTDTLSVPPAARRRVVGRPLPQ